MSRPCGSESVAYELRSADSSCHQDTERFLCFFVGNSPHVRVPLQLESLTASLVCGRLATRATQGSVQLQARALGKVEGTLWLLVGKRRGPPCPSGHRRGSERVSGEGRAREDQGTERQRPVS